MNKLKNLSKFLGVVIGLLLGQAVYAQKVVGPRIPTSTPPVTYVTGSTALSRIDAKINQYLGQWKLNAQNAQLKHQFYTILRVYASEGLVGEQAIKATLAKMKGMFPSKELTAEIVSEAATLLKQ